MQSWHAGRVSHVDLQPDGQAPVAPSAITAKAKTVLTQDGVPSFVANHRPLAERSLAQGTDLVVFGKLFIANPDLPQRLCEGPSLNQPD